MCLDNLCNQRQRMVHQDKRPNNQHSSRPCRYINHRRSKNLILHLRMNLHTSLFVKILVFKTRANYNLTNVTIFAHLWYTPSDMHSCHDNKSSSFGAAGSLWHAISIHDPCNLMYRTRGSGGTERSYMFLALLNPKTAILLQVGHG